MNKKRKKCSHTKLSFVYACHYSYDSVFKCKQCGKYVERQARIKA